MGCNYLCNQYQGYSKTEKSGWWGKHLSFQQSWVKKLDFWYNFYLLQWKTGWGGHVAPSSFECYGTEHKLILELIQAQNF